MKKIIDWFKSSASDFVLFILLLILVNIAGSKSFIRWDLTEQKSYSLSKASKTLVKNLDEPLSIRVFFDDDLPVDYSNISQYVEDLLDEYKRAANKNFTVSYMDLSKEENRDLAYSYGLTQVQIQEYNNNEFGVKSTYMGLALTYGDSIELIDPITSTEGIEYQITSTVSKMINTAASLESLKGDEKIKLYVILSNPVKNLRISGVDKIENEVEKVCKSINKAKMDKIDYVVINPEGDDVTAYTDKYGIQPINYRSADGIVKTGCIGVVVEYGEKFVTLPVQIQDLFFNNYAVVGMDDLENSINSAVQSLISKPTQIGYIVGHEELDLFSQDAASVFSNVVSESYELVTLDLTEDDIPASMKSIIINGPKMDMTEEELFKIDQFIMKGGNALFMVDPFQSEVQQTYYGNQTTYYENEVNIDRLLNKYGVKRETKMVLDNQCCQTYNDTYGILDLCWAPLLQKENMNKKNAISNNLGNVIMLMSSPLDISEAEKNANVKTTVLVESSKKAWLENASDMILNPMILASPEDESKLGKYTLMALLEGKFESAFDAAPAVNNPEDDSEGSGSAEGDYQVSNYISKSKQAGKIIVASTSAITTPQVFTADSSSGITLLLLNALDYLNGNEDLCKMRTKGVSVNVLNTDKKGLMSFFQILNEYGLTVLVALAGLIVWRMRNKRKEKINNTYNPNDDRFIDKSKKSEEEA